MKNRKLNGVLPYYFVGAFWVIFSFNWPLYRLSDFLRFIGISIAIFFILKKILPQPAPKARYAAMKTGNADIDEIAKKIAEAIRELRLCNDDIPDEKLSSQIDQLEHTAHQIMVFLTKNPANVRDVRTFINYYLPTTVKLLSSYSELAAQNSPGRNVAETMRKIENVLDVVVKAFEKQLDDLYLGKAMDISAEIKIFEFTMESEGIKKDML